MKRTWLVELRNIKDLTQLEVASKCGLSRSYYADIEQGRANASGRAAKLISEVLGFNMDIFFANVGRETRHNKNQSA